MVKLNTAFIIRNSKNEFLSIDLANGGYPYWGYLTTAKIYNSKEAANEVIEQNKGVSYCNTSDAKIYQVCLEEV
jgi:hypothetical protein